MGACVSSYGNTMSFSASTKVAEKSTRKAVTLFHNLSCKSNTYFNITATFGRPKVAQKASGWSAKRFLNISAASAELAGDIMRPLKHAAELANCGWFKIQKLSACLPKARTRNVALACNSKPVMSFSDMSQQRPDPRIQNKEASYSLDLRVDIPSKAGPLSSRRSRTAAKALFSPTIDSKSEGDCSELLKVTVKKKFVDR